VVAARPGKSLSGGTHRALGNQSTLARRLVLPALTSFFSEHHPPACALLTDPQHPQPPSVKVKRSHVPGTPPEHTRLTFSDNLFLIFINVLHVTHASEKTGLRQRKHKFVNCLHQLHHNFILYLYTTKEIR